MITAPMIPSPKMKVKMELVHKSFLENLLKKFPKNVSSRVQKTGMRRAAVILVQRLKQITPRGKKNTNPFHIQDHYGFKQVTFRKTGNHSTIVGLTKGHGYLAHILEHGTADRRTNSASGSKVIGYRWIMKRVNGKGPKRRVRVKIERSTGSVQRPGDGTFTGKMDANKYYGRLLQKAMDSTRSQQEDAINQSIQDSVIRELKRRGKP